MRIRYNKPVKIKSLLGRQNISETITYIDAGYSYVPNVNNGFYGGWKSSLVASDNTRKFNIISGHTYFLYVDTIMVNPPLNRYNTCSIIMPNGDQLPAEDEQHTLKNTRYSASLITAPSDATVAPMIYNYNQSWTIGDTINYMLVLDLTAAGLDNLTIQQVYDRYHWKFAALAAGDEITISGGGRVQGVKLVSDNYVELEYIESTGTQWIDTGVTNTANISYELDFSSESMEPATGIIGGASWAGAFYRNSSSDFESSVAGSYSAWAYAAGRHIFKFSDQGSTLDGLPPFSSYSHIDNYSGSITVFKINKYTRKASMKLFSCRISDNGTVVRDLFPAMRKSDSAVGLLDRVHHVFYENQGAGVFIAGPARMLPNEYQEVEYITATGGQYIDTNFIPTNISKISLTINTNFRDLRSGIAGYGYFHTDGKTYEFDGVNNTLNSNIPIGTVATCTIDYSNNKVTINNFEGTTNINLSGNTLSFYLLNRNGNLVSTSAGSLYESKIYNNNILVHNFIPCYRKLDNAIGMYDLVEGRFYANKGTGTFIAGPAKYLPNEYQEVEYIESTGTQYINTGIAPNADTKLESVWKQTVLTDKANYSGSVLNASGGWFAFGGYGNSVGIVSLLSKGSRAGAVIPADTNWHAFYVSNGLQKVDNATSTNTVDSLSGMALIYLLTGDVTWPDPDFENKQAIQYCKIWNGDVLVRDLIPCYRKSDNEIGMYDLVERQFYENAGTGTFVAGPVKHLPSEYLQVEYIESTGTQWIDTGVNFGNQTDVSFEFDFAVTEFLRSTNNVLAGGRGSTWLTVFEVGTGYRYSNMGTSTALNRVNEPVPLNTRMNLTVSAKNHELTYEGYYTASASFSGDLPSTNIYIFANNYEQSTSTSSIAAKLYGCNFSNNGAIIRSFVPCVRKSDLKPGLYDRMHNVFYGNAGTGEFKSSPIGNKGLPCRVAGGSSDIYYGYNQSLLYDGAAPTSIVVEYGSYVVNGKEITYTKNADTPYYSLTLYNDVASTGGSELVNCKPGDKILVSATFKNLSDSLIGLVAGLGACLYKGGTWLRNPKGLITFVAGQKTYSVIDTVDNDNCDNAKFKLLHGTTISGELFTLESVSIINLTDWFGAGKEPATVAEFQQKFNKEYYGFYPTPIKLTQYQIAAEPYYSYNQISYDKVTTKTVNGITLTNNGDGSYSIQGTATADCAFDGFAYPGVGEAVTNHVFIIRGAPATSTYSTYYLRNDNRPTEGKVDLGNGQIFTWTYAFAWAFQLVVKSGTVITSPVTFWPECIDLTQWYGEGNEPTTIEEFKATFPKVHYPYATKRLLNQYMINKLVD